jgi:SPP1 gp7 family putative phage head morphogenesis protein
VPTPDILAVSAAFEAQLDAGFTQAAMTMTAQYDQVLRGMDATVQALHKEYAARTAAGETIKPYMIAQDARYRELMAQVQTQLARLSNSGAPAIEDLQRAGIGLGMDTAEAQVGALVPPSVSIPFNRLPTEALESMVGFLQDGSPLKALLDDIAKDAARSIGDLLVRAIAEGWNPRKTAAAMRQAVGLPLTRALRIARTEQLRAWRKSSVQGYRDQGALIVGYRRHAQQDTRTCFACLMQDGTMYLLEEEFTDHIQGRCTVIPVTRSWKDLGFPDIPDTNAQWQPGKDWFLEQSADAQKEILGAARYGAWKRGEVGLEDMQTLHKSQKWGDSWQVASLKQAKANAGAP